MSKKLIAYFILLFSSFSLANENPLVGLWAYDKQMTLDSIESQQNVPEDLLSCHKKNICGGAWFEFTKNQYRIHIQAIRTITDYRDYTILSNSPDTITIETTDTKNETREFTWEIKDKIGCRKAVRDGFKYDECYRKIR